tara:strand:- start:182 stop:880 length:699 start_codon:yes stop_codon:yes gene_type:complete
MNNKNHININLSNLTLVIPAKEEVDCLNKVLEELQYFNYQKIVIIPKDKSLPSDLKFKNIKVINQSKDGYGNAILEGIENVKTKFFCIFNADGSFNPNEIENMMLKTNTHDFVFGSRYLKNGKSDDDTFITKIGNFFFSNVGKKFFNLKLSDILYTYVVANTSKFRELGVKSNDFCFCVEFPIKMQKNNFSYIDTPSHERIRISGKKNVNEIVDGSKILFQMIKLFFSNNNK